MEETYITLREYENNRELDSKYQEKCLECIEVKFKANADALTLATTEAAKQYHTLNNTRAEMLTKEIYQAQYTMVSQSIDELKKLVYIGLGLVYALIATAGIVEIIIKLTN